MLCLITVRCCRSVWMKIHWRILILSQIYFRLSIPQKLSFPICIPNHPQSKDSSSIYQSLNGLIWHIFLSFYEYLCSGEFSLHKCNELLNTSCHTSPSPYICAVSSAVRPHTFAACTCRRMSATPPPPPLDDDWNDRPINNHNPFADFPHYAHHLNKITAPPRSTEPKLQARWRCHTYSVASRQNCRLSSQYRRGTHTYS